MNQRKNTFFKILLITVGLFFLITLFGFHPGDTLYFSNELPSQVQHFLGRVGATTSAFLFYYIGRSSFLFSVLLIYTGYLFLRKISSARKTIAAILSFFVIITAMMLFSLLNNKVLYKGGGIFGNSIVFSLKNKASIWIPIVSLIVSGEAFLLFLASFKGVLRLHKASIQGDEVTRPKAPRIIGKMRRNKKLPFVKKVLIDENGDVIIDESMKQERDRYPGKRIVLKDHDTGPEPAPQSQEQHMPDISLLKRSRPINEREREKETQKKARDLEKTLREFDIEARVIGITCGPVITRYELQPAPGVKLSRIVNLSDNIALNLSAPGVRIEAPIPGRSAVGIEIPNAQREIVTLGDILDEAEKDGELPLILGKDISGEVVTHDLTAMPHLLIAGATGAGKSVCVNSLIVSLLLQKTHNDLKFIMIDPKMVELKFYNGIPHLLTEVVTDPRHASKALRWIVYEMENRYHLLDKHYARDIKGYNQKADEKLPYIVVIVDEFANLMAISPKEVEDACVRLASMSRAVGIHLIMSTQRPSVDVITGLIKANFPFRIAFQVASKTDSRTILDYSGAEKLLGRGDMLFSPAGSMNIKRVQGAFISEDELLGIVNKLKQEASVEYELDITSLDKEEVYDVEQNDPIFEEAVDIVVKTKRASASFLQRRLKIGYNRAARLIELMEEKGIIGPPRGSKPREIFVDSIE
jgi:DNA segregation ATPase FtsK/SpoIIIE-like protein